MKLLPASLGGRLVLGAIVITLVAGMVTLYGVGALLSRFVTGQIDQRLDNKIVALASQVKVAPDGLIHLDGDADGPPFDKPRHRSFWWVGGPKNSIETRWLPPGAFVPPTPEQIDRVAPPPPPPPAEPPPDPDGPAPPDARARSLDVAGPQGVPIHLRVSRRDIAGMQVTILAAAPQEAIQGPLRDAMSSLGTAVMALGLILFVAAFALVRIALYPLERLRAEIAYVRNGTSVALPDTQPIEIRPLVTELNSLLAQNAETLARTRRYVANLAHGLKTPLATLSLTAARVKDEDGATMRELIAAIERRVRHHLGRARAAALDGPVRARTLLRPRIGDLLDMLRKLHADRGVLASLDCGLHEVVACEPQDVDEMLGNLLENAFTYARRRVTCQVRVAGPSITIDITDDGPGLAPHQIDHALRPGHRLDEAAPGHGFGLPITRELAELYGGTLDLTPQARGLKATLTLPRAV